MFLVDVINLKNNIGCFYVVILIVLIFVIADTMENWDEKKLEEVVNKKHGEADMKKSKTQIVGSGRKFTLTILHLNHLDISIDVI